MKLLFILPLFLLPAAIAAQQQAMHAPDGGARERLQSIDVLPKPGAPFSATVVTDWTRLLEDGTTTTVKNHRIIARDSAGRIFQERRFLMPNGDTKVTPLSTLEYADPVRHEFLDCRPATLVCTIYPYNRPATIPIAATGALPNGNGSITRETIGTKRVDNLDLEGSREITTLNAGVNGYQHAEPTVKEFWYSPRLEINVITKRFEPRGGAQNIILTAVSLDNPDPKLFVPPANYSVVRMTPQ